VTGIGPVRVRVPKLRSRTERKVVFRSSLAPPYVRRAKRVDAALPWLYLKGISSNDISSALGVLVGPEASGVSASVLSRLKTAWAREYDSWCKRPLDRHRIVYAWADGIYSGLRSEGRKLCVLVVIGADEHGRKHLLAIEEGVRESEQSWREVLLGLKARGLVEPPKVATGDGALGFWAALEKVYPETVGQRCWVHKTSNVLNYLPKTVQPKAKKALQEIFAAPDRKAAEAAFDLFLEVYEAKYPKAASCLAKDRETLLAFFDLPAKHWIHLRTTNPIESTFATIKHRTKRSKSCLTRMGMLTMMFKLGQAAEKRWRRLRGSDYVAKVIQGVQFKDGLEVQKEEEQSNDRNVA